MDIGHVGYQSGIDSIKQMNEQLQQKISDISSGNVTDQNAAMLEMQFQMGQYNAMIEMTSNITKSISDTLKSIAQKI